MNAAQLNRLIPAAIKAIKDSKMDEYKDEKDHVIHNTVPNALKGYIPAMGASIMQSGLLPTLAFYANNSGKEADSTKLLDAILKIIAPNTQNTLIQYVLNTCKKDNTTVGSLSKNELDVYQIARVTQKVLDALTALKLAVRTFKISEK